MSVIVLPDVRANTCTVLWDNELSRGTITSTSTDPSRPAINAFKDVGTASTWRTTAAGGSATVDLGDFPLVTAIGVAAHDLWTSGAGLLIEASYSTSDFQEIVTYTATTNEDVMFIMPSKFYRYYRFTITGAAANIGVIFAGSRLIFPQAPVIDYVPLYHARQYTKEFNTSLGGQLITNRVQAVAAETDVDMWLLDRTWVDNTMAGFEDHYNQGGTFFYASQPTVYPRDMGYCSAPDSGSSVSVSYSDGPTLASVSFPILSYLSV